MEEKGEVREVRDEEGIDEMVSDQFKSLLMYYIDNNKVIELAKDFKYLSPYINIVLITKVCDNYAILIEHHDGNFDVVPTPTKNVVPIPIAFDVILLNGIYSISSPLTKK